MIRPTIYRPVCLLFIFTVISLLLSPALARAATWTIDERGNLFSFSDGLILGSQSDEQTSKLTSEMQRQNTKVRLEMIRGKPVMKLKDATTGAAQEIDAETKNQEAEQESEAEVPELSDLTREVQSLEREITQGLELEDENQGTENGSGSGNLLTIREREGVHDVTVSAENGKFVITKNRIGAVASFPLSVDLSTNTLSVTTPAGEKSVTVLPDEAAQQMLNGNILDRVGAETTTQSAGESAMKLIQTQQGVLAYEVVGVKHRRILGVLPIDIQTTAVVSAETGELLNATISLRNRLLELVSF